MKLNRNELLKKINFLKPAFSRKASIPALQFIKFDNGTMTLCDTVNAISTKIEFVSSEDEIKQALIPFETFEKIISKVKNLTLCSVLMVLTVYWLKVELIFITQ